jgi:hypothetical protein
MKTHNVTLTDAELLMVIEGLSAIASDYCTSRDEERPFNELKAKLTPLVTSATTAKETDLEDDEFVLIERQWKGK